MEKQMDKPLPVLSCDGCGVCCRNQSSPPIMPEEMDQLLIDHPGLHLEIECYLNGPDYDDSKPCIWLGEDKKCKHYEQRPEVCREYEVGCFSCVEQRKQNGIQTKSQ